MDKVWFVSPEVVDKGGDGSEAKPWSLRHAASGAGGSIKAGDTVSLRGGRYQAPRGYVVSVSGESGRPVTFAPYPGETPLIDGGIPEFQSPGNSAWEPVALGPGCNVYRSAAEVTSRAEIPIFRGLIALDGGLHTLAAHRLPYLVSGIHSWTKGPVPRYLGPGLAYDKVSKRIYIRLDNSLPEAQQGRTTVTQIPDPDPRKYAIHIASNEFPGFTIRGSYLRFEGIHLRGHDVGWFVEGHKAGLELIDCVAEPQLFVARLGRSSDAKVLGGVYDGHMHSPTWWVAYTDIKGAEAGETPPADHVRKCAFDLGAASDVELGPSPDGTRMIVRGFFDGILAKGPLRDIDVHGIWFDEIWDDAWQQFSNISNVNYYDNVHFGAGPSRDGAVKDWKPDGTVWIHDNVIDTTLRPIFWARQGRDSRYVLREPIAFSGHGVPAADKPAFPWKLYHNTVCTGALPDFSELVTGPFGSNTATGQRPHEVYNNIFVVRNGRPLARKVNAVSGLEVYDGDCLWSAGAWEKRNGPYRELVVKNGTLNPGQRPELRTVAGLRASRAHTDSKAHYPPGWYNSSIEVDPALDESYRPTEDAVLTGAVDISRKRWPGVEAYRPERGARLTTPFPPAPMRSALLDERPVRSA